MSQQRRHPQREVDGRRTTKEWGKSGKRLMHEARVARRRTHEWASRLRRDKGEE